MLLRVTSLEQHTSAVEELFGLWRGLKLNTYLTDAICAALRRDDPIQRLGLLPSDEPSKVTDIMSVRETTHQSSELRERPRG